jgi:hypothetical protein
MAELSWLQKAEEFQNSLRAAILWFPAYELWTVPLNNTIICTSMQFYYTNSYLYLKILPSV